MVFRVITSRSSFSWHAANIKENNFSHCVRRLEWATGEWGKKTTKGRRGKREKNKINLVYRSLDLKIKKEKVAGSFQYELLRVSFHVVCRGMAFEAKYKFQSFLNFDSRIIM